jgi:hypothetical protein
MKSLNSPPDATTVATPPKSKFLSVKFTTVLLMAISPLAVQGAVLVTGQGTYGESDYTNPFSYTVVGADSMLVVGLYNDNNGTPTGASFGGVAADGSLQFNRMLIAYWKNPTTGSGDFSFSGIDATRPILAGAYELSGVDLDAVVTGTSNNASTNTITTPTANEFVISYAASNSATAITANTSSIINSNTFGFGGILNVPETPSTTNYLAGGTGLAGAAGSQDVTWDNEDRGSLTYSFQAVPEPSSAALTGLAGLALMLRRRR